MQQSPIERVLASTNLTLFFSLPFRPAARRNAFYNGHIAVGLQGQVYQVYNPQLLKSSFLFSVMPVADWLFGKGGKWVERDPSSPKFRHVYLYKTCETRRTVVYAAGIRASETMVTAIRTVFDDEDRRFRTGGIRYDFLRSNCSSIIASGLVRCGLLGTGPANLVPALLFKRFVARCRPHMPCSHWKRRRRLTRSFSLHRFCIGLWGMRPRKAWTIGSWKRPRPHHSSTVHTFKHRKEKTV